MPVPLQYTEAQFAEYLVNTLSNVASVLGWQVNTPAIEEAVTDTELALGVSDVADATEIAAVRVLGERAVLRRAQTALAAFYDVAEDQQTYQRSQAFTAVTKRLAAVETEALRYGRAGYAVGVGSRQYLADPYVVLPDSARVLP